MIEWCRSLWTVHSRSCFASGMQRARIGLCATVPRTSVRTCLTGTTTPLALLSPAVPLELQLPASLCKDLWYLLVSLYSPNSLGLITMCCSSFLNNAQHT